LRRRAAGGIVNTMTSDTERDLGAQPIAAIMVMHGLKARDLVACSTEQITHKMVSRAVKGRRLTPHVQRKILNALNSAAKTKYVINNLFSY